MKNRKLLIVDSDPKNLRILKNNFFEMGYLVDEAVQDQEAIEKITQSDYDGILTELTLAEIDGLKILAHLQRNGQTRTTVIFLTSKSDVWNRVKSFKLGVKDYIVKPIHVREITARTEMILARQDRCQEHQNRRMTFSGRLEDLSLTDLITVLGAEKKTGVLYVYNENNLSGRATFHEGCVIQAVAGDTQAEEAVYKMMAWRQGRFSMRFSPVEIVDEIGVSNMGLLLQGAKRMDQREELLKQLPSLDAVLVTTSNFKKIVSQKNLATGLDYFISLFDGQRSLGRIVDESTYDEITTLSRILKLYQLGFLHSLRDYVEPTTDSAPGLSPAKQAVILPKAESVADESRQNPTLPEEETWPEEDAEEVVASFQHDALNSLESDLEEADADPQANSAEETELAVQHDFANDGISELLTKDYSKWGADSGYEKDLFYELRTAAEKQPAFHSAPSSPEPTDDSQLLFPTLEMLEQEHPADALLMLPAEHAYPLEEKPQPPTARPFIERTAPPLATPRNGRQPRQENKPGKNAYGHVLVLGSQDEMRRRMVASLTANQVQIKEYENPDWSNLYFGLSEFKGGHSLNIISLSLRKEFTALLEHFSRSLFGYLLLVDVIPADWDYYRYCIKALQQTLALPFMLIVPSSLSLSVNMTEHEWRKVLGLTDQQLLATHVEFDPTTCKRFIFRLFENYYRRQLSSPLNVKRTATV
jgi:DNA-binding response OmpR family regulator